MAKFNHLLKSRCTLSEMLLAGKASKFRDATWSCSSISRAGISTARPDMAPYENPSGRVFVNYTLFKGKAALSMSPILPKFSPVNNGNLRVEKSGAMLLAFWPAIAERKYNWEKKQVFALSTTELGSLISLGSGESCEFLHDPSMKSSNEGQVKKSLSVRPISEDGGYFFSLNVTNMLQKTSERLFVPVSKAEYAVMRTTFSFILPRIMGWDRLSSLLPARTSNDEASMNQVRRPEQLSPDLEWDR